MRFVGRALALRRDDDHVLRRSLRRSRPAGWWRRSRRPAPHAAPASPLSRSVPAPRTAARSARRCAGSRWPASRRSLSASSEKPISGTLTSSMAQPCRAHAAVRHVLEPQQHLLAGVRRQVHRLLDPLRRLAAAALAAVGRPVRLLHRVVVASSACRAAPARSRRRRSTPRRSRSRTSARCRTTSRS